MKNERSLIYKIYSKKTINRISKKVLLLGTDSNYNVNKILSYQLLLFCVVFIFVFLSFDYGFLLAPIISFLVYFIIEIILLDKPIKRRTKSLEDEAIFFFEILGLTLETGRNVKTAIEVTSKNIDSELSKEFKKTLDEVKLGKSFTEALNSMKERIPSDIINNIILNLVESSVYGHSIVDSLNNQLDFLREKKLLDLKAIMSKLPTKISIVSVLFFIPIMILIILSPVIIEFLMQ